MSVAIRGVRACGTIGMYALITNTVLGKVARIITLGTTTAGDAQAEGDDDVLGEAAQGPRDGRKREH